MATAFDYPTDIELREIAQDKMPRLQADRPIFQILPIREVDDSQLAWEQKDNYVGLQAVRGMGGEPHRVNKVGGKRFTADPGIYGEYVTLNEREITRRRHLGQFGTPVSIKDLVMDAQDFLLGRRLDRIELIGWTLLLTGVFSVSSEDGTIVHTDTYPNQTFSPTYPWSDKTRSTPLADLRTILTLHRGHSVSFSKGDVYFNQTVVNNMLLNANAADLGGRRGPGLATINSLEDLNRLLSADGLPTINIYDETYFDNAGATQLFIPDGEGCVIGKRKAGQVIGEYQMTRNASNDNLAPGPYMYVDDNKKAPRRVDVHDGHNGGPTLDYPSSVVSLSGLL